MRRQYFIHENSHRHKIKTLIIAFFSLLLLFALSILFLIFGYGLFQRIPLWHSVENNIINFTPLGLFYGNFLGGIFFIPTPDEILFYYGLLRGISPITMIIFSVGGYMFAQIINYILGWKISGFVLNIASKKKVYKTRRFVNKYGMLGVFLFNLLPLPAPLLTFALGIAKYNFTKLFIMTVLGKVGKYLFLILLYFIISR